MTAGAAQLLRWMRFRGSVACQLWWGQDRMAADLKVARRTLQRWLAELVAARLVDSIRRGPRSNLYTLSSEKACAKAVENGQSFGASSQLYLFTESKALKEQQARKPVSSEIRGRIRIGSVELSTDLLPEPMVENAYGRREVNPAWRRACAAIDAANERIGRARNPEAYMRAILKREGVA